MKTLLLNPVVQQALEKGQAIVALESTVITHGLPYPQNRDTALAMEAQVRAAGAQPATICLIDGHIHVGIDEAQMERIAAGQGAIKVSRRNIAATMVAGHDGGTTVGGTMEIAYKAGIRVFATGGIGGVHRGNLTDVSSDLPTLAQVPLVVVCSGAKAILDLAATREYLETSGVPVLGYQCDDLPAFYSTSSALPVDDRVESAEQVARIALAHWEFGLRSAILVTVPPPSELAIPAEEIEVSIRIAMDEALSKGIKGAEVTPFLLARVSQHSSERSMRVNIALLKNNAHIAGLIALELAALTGKS